MVLFHVFEAALIAQSDAHSALEPARTRIAGIDTVFDLSRPSESFGIAKAFTGVGILADFAVIQRLRMNHVGGWERLKG